MIKKVIGKEKKEWAVSQEETEIRSITKLIGKEFWRKENRNGLNKEEGKWNR